MKRRDKQLWKKIETELDNALHDLLPSKRNLQLRKVTYCLKLERKDLNSYFLLIAIGVFLIRFVYNYQLFLPVYIANVTQTFVFLV